ncbi:zinc-finger domain-containing protein [Neptunicoccus cionae]|uniref:zinc-finger domain-containing protein n=1 Tax=Neptunicoccus cionae TaxID=2035344 RepID=UPI000C759816|nr:zinc-finger domain-containing protein [Amylibacter cionae]PLS21694.1 zinc-finger domain-containing protein [Amylibacter cionae]
MTIEAPEVKEVDSYRVACDGGVGGHPRVWLQIPHDTGWVECPYCDCKYVIREGAAAGH